MTTDQAIARLKAKFPGKKFYISCHYWTHENGKSDQPDFDVCVYGVHGKDNATGNGDTLSDAVAKALAYEPPSGVKDADAMFSVPAAIIAPAVVGQMAGCEGEE